MCPALLAQLIGAFRKRFPKVEVSIQQQNSFKWVQGAQKRADIGIGYTPTESTGGPIGTLKSWLIASAPVAVAVAATTEQGHHSFERGWLVLPAAGGTKFCQNFEESDLVI
jgi:DNA-binding transcriptional LysR family regulator